MQLYAYTAIKQTRCSRFKGTRLPHVLYAVGPLPFRSIHRETLGQGAYELRPCEAPECGWRVPMAPTYMRGIVRAAIRRLDIYCPTCLCAAVDNNCL
jgi:hypothetical protein